jgi:trehalose 6-phosphate synthase
VTRLVVVSNRVSAPTERDSRAGGLAVAIREALRRHGGVWFGWSGRITEQPSPHPEVVSFGPITFATVDVSPSEHEAYYLGYANGSLWPVLHYRPDLLDFRRAHFEGYLRVNARFAAILAPLIQPGDLVWVHDYHLIPLAEELRKLGIRNRIGFFLHTPFPASEVLTTLPDHERLMTSFGAYDLVGFQTETDLRSFRDYVVHEAGGECRQRSFVMGGRMGRASAFPIGIDTERFAMLAERAAHSPETLRLKQSLADRHLIIGVDRLDYSKGLLDRFEAMAILLDGYPEHCGRVTYLQIAPPSRMDVAQYQTIRRDLERAAGRVNGRFAEFDWAPIRYLNKSFPRNTLAGFYRISRVGLVTPLRDGMNLVAKEYVAAQDPEDPGVLVLSRFAGAAQELKTAALIVNPNDRDSVADALHRALDMPRAERRSRWEAMHDILRGNTITTWHNRFLSALQATDRLRDTRPAEVG